LTTTDTQHSWESIDAIATAVRSCTACALHNGRTNAVSGSGSPTAGILIIGEGPGFNEDQQGLPFVGRSGKLLDELLAEVPLTRDDVFITNVVKCRPPDNRDPLPDEVAACRPYLQRQMELLDPRVIVTLGRHSLLRFYPEGKISKDHGKIFAWEGRILFPLYHPAAGLRNPAIKQELQQDVLRLPEALQESIRISVNQREPEEENEEQRNETDLQLVDSLSSQTAEAENAEAQLSEPILKNETTKEQGDRQLGMF
jgi:DNA polymerase|tara:strand:+ start:348 stop:1115 length:768 start_codon:yes stop_codon:yes gene_type:complete